MEAIIRELYLKQKRLDETLAILIIDKDKTPLTVTDGFDVIVLAIIDQADEMWNVKHYYLNEKHVSLHFLSEELMNQTLIVGSQRRLIDWLVNGKILFDRNYFLKALKERMHTFPPVDRAKKMTIQFTKLLRRFEEGKTLFDNGHYFDAFSNMMHALHHLARLSVIHHGYFPEVTVWEQIRHIEPQTYKLYQELLNSEETLEERIELLILATEFAIQSKTEIGSWHFLSLWTKERLSFSEMMRKPEVEDYRIDLELLVHHLIEKEFLFYERRGMLRGDEEEVYYLNRMKR